MNRINIAIQIMILNCVCGLSLAQTVIPVKSFDGYALDAVFEPAPGQTIDNFDKVIVFIHGSGPQNLDSDFSALSPKKQKILFFKDLAAEFRKKGYSTFRYHKRSYQVALSRQSNPNFSKSKIFKDYAANPLKYFVNDAAFMAKRLKKNNPKAKIYLFGHSQGAVIAPIVAQKHRLVDGVILVGHSSQSLDTLIYEQTVYRPLSIFRGLDKNSDEKLSVGELSVGTAFANSIKRQIPLLDLDKDNALSFSEIQAGNLSNLTLQGRKQFQAFAIQEAKYPAQNEIFKTAKFKVYFIHGEWDNQTPSFGVKAIELANKAVWKNQNLKFHYIKDVGHALDPRQSYDDLSYSPMDDVTKKHLAFLVAKFFR